jgi:hypothetical protein
MEAYASTPPPLPDMVGNKVGVRVIVGKGMDVTVCAVERCVGLGGMEVTVDRTDVADGSSVLVTGDAFPHPGISNNSNNAKAIIFFIRMIFSSSL